MISFAATIFVKQSRGPALKLASLNLLINFLLYNPVLALQIMEAQHVGLVRALLDEWFVALKSPNGKGLPRVHDKRLSIIALSTLMEMDPSRVPVGLKEGWPGLLGGALHVFETLDEAISSQ
jgi:importin-7